MLIILINKDNCIIRDKIVKQLSSIMLFAKLCDGEFNKKHIGINILSLQLCVHEKMLTIACAKDTTFVSRCWGLLLEDSRVTVRSFDKSRKLMIL